MSDISIQPVGVPRFYGACEFVWKTQEPLDWCKSRFTMHSRGCLQRIAQVFECAIAIFLFLPALVIAGVGAFVNLGVNAPNINWDAVGKAPPRAALLDPEIVSGQLSNVDVSTELGQWFFTYISQEDGETRSFAAHINEIMNSITNDYVLENAKTYLKHIVLHLREECHEPKRQAAVVKLCEAYKACKPTWLEGTKKVWNELSGQDDPKNKLLGWVQDVKEEMIKEEVQIVRNHSQWHGLNYVRQHRGERYGLDMTLNIENADTYARRMAPFSAPEQIDDFFYSSYTESRLINGVVTRMHMELEGYGDYDRCHFIELLRGAVNDSDYAVMENLFETYTILHPQVGEMEEYRINTKGVMVLLLAIGQLK